MAAALRCFRLGEQSLWIDEVLTWLGAGAGLPLTWHQLVENVHGPLHALLLSQWIRVAGDSEWALRFPSAVFGTAMVPAMAWLSARWLGRETAPAAAWLTACSPFLVWYSQEARNYALLMLCVCVSAALLLEMQRRLTAPRTIGYATSAAAGLLSNLSFVFLAPLHFRWWLGESLGRTARLRAMGVSLIGIALLVSPWFVQSFHVWDWNRLQPTHEAEVREAPLRTNTSLHPALVPYAAYAFSVGYSFGPPLRALRGRAPLQAVRAHAPAVGAAALVFGLLLFAGWRALARRGRRLDLLLWMLAPTVIVGYFANQSFKVFHPRYLAVALPPFLLMLAAALTDMRPRARRLAVAALAVIWGVALWNLYFDPRYARDDLRGAAEVIRAEAMPGEQVLAVYTLEPMEYYLGQLLPIRSFWLGFVDRPEALEARLDSALVEADGSWIVLSRPEDLDPGGAFARHMAARFPDARAYERTGVRVWHVTAGPDTLH
jgi:mannosyltransferase